MHQARGSGSIEQDSDTMILLHRKGLEGPNWIIDALVEKQRNFRPGKAELLMHGPTMRFESLSPISPGDVPN